MCIVLIQFNKMRLQILIIVANYIWEFDSNAKMYFNQ